MTASHTAVADAKGQLGQAEVPEVSQGETVTVVAEAAKKKMKKRTQKIKKKKTKKIHPPKRASGQ